MRGIAQLAIVAENRGLYLPHTSPAAKIVSAAPAPQRFFRPGDQLNSLVRAASVIAVTAGCLMRRSGEMT